MEKKREIFLVEHTASEMIVYDISKGAVGDYLCKIPISGEALFIDEQGRISAWAEIEILKKEKPTL